MEIFKKLKDLTGTWAWKHPHEDGTVTYHKQEGRVTFTDVTFGYNDDKMVLHDINLFAEPGQRLPLSVQLVLVKQPLRT